MELRFRKMPCLFLSFLVLISGRLAQISGLNQSDQRFNLMKTEIYKDEGYRFMGAAFEVYNDRGYGLAEEIYQECLEIELEMRGISFRPRKRSNASTKAGH